MCFKVSESDQYMRFQADTALTASTGSVSLSGGALRQQNIDDK